MTSDTTNGRRPAQTQELKTKAGEVLQLVLDNSVRERFRQQCRLFYDKRQSWWKENNACDVALKPFNKKVYDCLVEQCRCTARMGELRKQGLQTSPEYRRLEKAERRYIEEKAKADEELKKTEAKLQSPEPCPDEWLEVPAARHQPRNVCDILEHVFQDDDPGIPEEAVPLRAYVLLTILHDYALKNEVSFVADDEVWPRDNDAVPEPSAPTPWQTTKDFALSVWKKMEANPSSSCGAIDRALCVVQADLAEQKNHATEKATETGAGTEKRQKGSPVKYSDELCRRAQAEYDELQAKQVDSKGAWSTVARHQGFPNGKAARAACYRYRRKLASAN